MAMHQRNCGNKTNPMEIAGMVESRTDYRIGEMCNGI